jgi:phosphatidylserine/phosphatidylglycerophosphate/cardiolipin synthase-like enzyme
MRACPRVHLKMVAIDGALLYLGSANFTGAGLGAKGDGRRNFEMGILTDDEFLLDQAQARFDRIWRGAECAGCRLRRECPAPLDQVAEERGTRMASPRRPREQRDSTAGQARRDVRAVSAAGASSRADRRR